MKSFSTVRRIVLFCVSAALIAATPILAQTEVNSNSIINEGIEYYMQTDKKDYKLGENVEMLYRVTNLGVGNVTLGVVMADPLNYYKFRVMRNGIQIWEYYHATAVLAFHGFGLDSYESKTFQDTWTMMNNNGTRVIKDDDFPEVPYAGNDDDFPDGPFIYTVVGELDIVNKVPVTVNISIIGSVRPNIEEENPTEFILQNYPNPFNPTTTIEYAIPAGISEQVSLKVYDLRGALVRTLVDEVYDPGTYSAMWDGTDDTGNKVSSGVYIYRLQAGKFTKSNRMLLVK